jgi:hypothetical protein
VVVGPDGKREFLNAYGVMAGSMITGMIDSEIDSSVFFEFEVRSGRDPIVWRTSNAAH